MKNFRIPVLFVVFLFSIISCSEKRNETETANEIAVPKRFYLPLEYYPHYETLFFESGKGYVIKNENSNKLIITLGGGPGWESAIGRPGERIIGRFIDMFLPLQEEYNIFIPEKFDWEVGRSYLYDVNAREQYTVDNLLAIYAGVINEYLSQNDYEPIIIAGISEGAVILPELYFLLEESHKITALISISGGGLSRFERTRIEYNKLITGKKPYVAPYIDVRARINGAEYIFDAYREEPYPDTNERMGLITTRWLTSYIFRRPYDYYVDIDIPVLFIHGEMDINVPVESTKYVQENLPDKPFDYIYYPEMEHSPLLEELLILREDNKGWLREKGL